MMEPNTSAHIPVVTGSGKGDKGMKGIKQSKK
jgi:hypothetical protein